MEIKIIERTKDSLSHVLYQLPIVCNDHAVYEVDNSYDERLGHILFDNRKGLNMWVWLQSPEIQMGIDGMKPVLAKMIKLTEAEPPETKVE